MNDATAPRTSIVRAPGRVNVIGGQIDFHEGIVIAAALDLDVVCTYSARDDGLVTLRSEGFDGELRVAADGSVEPSEVEPDWARNAAGLVRTLAVRGRPARGVDVAATSTVPAGAGLSSSAALDCALGLALADVASWTIDRRDLAHACMEAEHIGSGFRCGIMDPITSLFGSADHLLMIDCRDLSIRTLPLPSSVRLALVHTGVARRLDMTPYNDRRAAALAIAPRLGLRALRDASLDQVAEEPLGQHVVNEIERVRAFGAALDLGGVEALGPLMLASHASSRDFVGVSIPELDALVDALVSAGALGARLTGGGFGGCVVALVPTDRAAEVVGTAVAAYTECTGLQPLVSFVARPAAGAGPVPG